MTPRGDRERSRKIRSLKIRNEKHYRPASDHIVQVVERHRRVGSPALRLEKQNLADDSERVGSALLRRDKQFHAVGEQEEPDFVVVANRTERQKTGNLGREL